jgi:hypothetical protein
MRFILSGLLCLLATLCLSQSANIPKVTPPSPHAAAFQKYSDIPVTLHTGVPDVSVPLYEIKSGDITIPISLSYHASGIKVADEASKVGLGWVINQGGLISRNIMGLDDTETGGGTSYHHTNIPELPFTTAEDFSYSMSNVQYGCPVVIGNGNYDFERYDSQPDQYYFNFPGHTGKFIFTRDKQVLLAEISKIKIVPMDYGAGFTVKTPDGFTYVFSALETYAGEPDGANHNVAWYITTITSPKNDIVTFTYDTYSNYIRTTGQFIETDNSVSFGYEVNNGNSPGSPQGSYRALSPGKQYSNVVLSRIDFKEGYVQFSYSDREDLQNDKKLDLIEIYRTSSGLQQHDVIKKFSLEYEYFDGSADPDYASGAPVNFATKRLKLKRVIERSPDNKDGQIYQFNYYHEYEDPITLPAKTSFARDHWGYFNGKFINTSLIPTFSIQPSNDISRFYLGIPGDERDTNPARVDLFALKEIIYPTNGRTELEYEAHDFDYGKSMVFDNSYFKDYPETDVKTNSINYNGNIYGYQPIAAELASKTIDARDLYVDKESGVGTLELSMFFRFNQTITNCAIGAHNITFELTKEDGTNISGPTNIAEILNASPPPSAQCSNGSGITFSNSYHVGPGRYIWKLYIPQNDNLFASVMLNSKFSAVVTKNILPAGGLRIRRMKTFDGQSPTPILKKYDYHYFADDNNDGQQEEHTYGRRMVAPQYSYWERNDSEHCEVIDLAEFCNVIIIQNLKRTNESTVSLGSNGSPVSYDQVTVFYGGNGENGKTTYSYHNMPDLVLKYAVEDHLGTTIALLPKQPPVISTIPDVMNGKLLEQTDFRLKSGVYQPVKKISHFYRNDRLPYEAVVYGIQWRQMSESRVQCSRYENYLSPVFQISRIYESNSTEQDFDPESGRHAVKGEEFYYENQAHLQLTRHVEIFNGKVRTTRIKYPADYPDADCTPVLQFMKTTGFMHALPVEKTILEGSEVLSRELTEYNYFNTTMALPKTMATLKLNKPRAGVPDYVPASGIDVSQYKIAATINYNAEGNVSTISKPNDYSTVYIWGYDNALPVAEIKNADLSQVYYNGFEDLATGYSDGRTGDRSSASGIDKTLTGLKPGTYLLSYWLKSAATWVLQPPQEIAVTGSSYRINLAGQIDDVRFLPKNALMTTYTYAPMIGVTSVTDANNQTAFYEYDSFNRLFMIRDFEGNILKRYTYNYQVK